jgi:hypothetical protein
MKMWHDYVILGIAICGVAFAFRVLFGVLTREYKGPWSE